jgi:hypothetical protein
MSAFDAARRVLRPRSGLVEAPFGQRAGYAYRIHLSHGHES